MGSAQLDHTDDEYGPETNFWVKVRGYITCTHQPRLGPELGGSKIWCNPSSLSTSHGSGARRPHILSAGSGGDFAYEMFCRKFWPQGSTVVTLDCTTIGAPTISRGPDNATQVSLPICLKGEDDRYMVGIHENLVPGFLRWRDMTAAARQFLGEHFDHWDVIKANIEGFEYPLFADVFQSPDSELEGVSMIHIELHRMGMQLRGLRWSSLVLYELLLAHFFSGGFIPFATEKWHDSTAATDVAFVNQSFYIASEVAAARDVRTALQDVLPPLENSAELSFPPGTLTALECQELVEEAERLGFRSATDPVDDIAELTSHLFYCPSESKCQGLNPELSSGAVAALEKVRARFEAEVLEQIGDDMVVYWVYLRKYEAGSARTGLAMHTDSCHYTGIVMLSNNTASFAGGDYYLLDGPASAAVRWQLGFLDEAETFADLKARTDRLTDQMRSSQELARFRRPLQQGGGVAHPGDRAHGVLEVTQGVRYTLIFFANKRGVVTQEYDPRARSTPRAL
mmetsp:Transcript_44670/g.100845  ORF Transcript_44670/g.100845 Transcript_44670/m.100845 type:complete len:511 (+) Transcript_44670:659-2191(+)